MLEGVGFFGGLLFGLVFSAVIMSPFYLFFSWLGKKLETPQEREAALERKYGVDYRIHCEKKFGKRWRTVCRVDYSDV